MDAFQIVALIFFVLSAVYVIYAVFKWMSDGTANLVPIIIVLLLLIFQFGSSKVGGPDEIHEFTKWTESVVMGSKDFLKLDVSENAMYGLFGLLFLSMISLVIGMVASKKEAMRSAAKLFLASVLLITSLSIAYPHIKWKVISEELGINQAIGLSDENGKTSEDNGTKSDETKPKKPRTPNYRFSTKKGPTI